MRKAGFLCIPISKARSQVVRGDLRTWGLLSLRVQAGNSEGNEKHTLLLLMSGFTQQSITWPPQSSRCRGLGKDQVRNRHLTHRHGAVVWVWNAPPGSYGRTLDPQLGVKPRSRTLLEEVNYWGYGLRILPVCSLLPDVEAMWPATSRSPCRALPVTRNYIPSNLSQNKPFLH